jgi:hypothetical protein
MSDPWLVTFQLLDAAGTRHTYVITDDVDGRTRARAWALAQSPSERAARGHVRLDPGYIDVLELTEQVRATTLRLI